MSVGGGTVNTVRIDLIVKPLSLSKYVKLDYYFYLENNFFMKEVDKYKK